MSCFDQHTPCILISVPTRHSSDLSVKLLFILFGGFAISRLLSTLLTILRGRMMTTVGARLGQDLRSMVFSRLQADRKSTRLNSSHVDFSYDVIFLTKLNIHITSIL